MPLAQTITVVNKSGKVVKTSKTLASVFKEAKVAYLDRKAEIKATRKSDLDQKDALRGLDHLDIEDRHRSKRRDSGASSRDSSSSTVYREPTSSHRPRLDRVNTDRSTRSNPGSPTSPRSPHPSRHGQSNLRFEESVSKGDHNVSGRELVRSNTDGILPRNNAHRRRSTRSSSLTDIESSLAFGEEHPPDLPLRPATQEIELRHQVTKLQMLLDEANCVGHSVGNMIEALQKNPDQLAAVALTLAEISALASKMAPTALMSLKGAFPAVIALLAAPEFMIGAGVGLGVTVIALGGYKIIKKVRKKKEGQKSLESGNQNVEATELDEIRSDLSRIEVWRRGIADVHADSTATSVDGEYITPAAKNQLISTGRLRESDLKSTKSHRSKMDKHDGRKSRKAEGDKRSSKPGHRDDDDSSVFDKGRALIKNPSEIKSLFKSSKTKGEGSMK